MCTDLAKAPARCQRLNAQRDVLPGQRVQHHLQQETKFGNMHNIWSLLQAAREGAHGLYWTLKYTAERGMLLLAVFAFDCLYMLRDGATKNCEYLKMMAVAIILR
eukprot:1183535-Prorocentrum_minimum.AAC.1